jgi:hypothetical protein
MYSVVLLLSTVRAILCDGAEHINRGNRRSLCRPSWKINGNEALLSPRSNWIVEERTRARGRGLLDLARTMTADRSTIAAPLLCCLRSLQD